MVDSKSGSNLLYLPLDKLLQQGGSGSVTVSAPQPTSVPEPQTLPSANDPRSRDNQRSRDGR
jgi:membrane protease subunit HflK